MGGRCSVSQPTDDDCACCGLDPAMGGGGPDWPCGTGAPPSCGARPGTGGPGQPPAVVGISDRVMRRLDGQPDLPPESEEDAGGDLEQQLMNRAPPQDKTWIQRITCVRQNHSDRLGITPADFEAAMKRVENLVHPDGAQTTSLGGAKDRLLNCVQAKKTVLCCNEEAAAYEKQVAVEQEKRLQLRALQWKAEERLKREEQKSKELAEDMIDGMIDGATGDQKGCDAGCQCHRAKK